MNSFTSAALGQIHTPINILKEFLQFFNRRQKCKAAILSWLDGKHYYGQEWVRITFEELADILGYCRETISKHLTELVADKFVEKRRANRFPKDTAYKYRLNLGWLNLEFDEVVLGYASKLLGLQECQHLLPKVLFRCEKIDISVPKNSRIDANNPATYRNILKPFKNNNTAVGEVKDEEVEESEYEPVRQVREPEQPQNSHFVDEQEQDDSADEIDPHEDQFSQSEVEVGSSTYKPSKGEISEVCTELRRLRINPEPCLGVVKKYWANLPGAIARVKEGIHEGWCDNPTGLFINSCKSGSKGKNVVTSDVSAWFNWAYEKRIVVAMSGGSIAYTPDGKTVDLLQMMQCYPCPECS
jgi:DNA-binding Lrp family transcriptional regulator